MQGLPSRPALVGISWVLVALTMAFYFYEMWPPAAQIDDAYISYRYAQNLADGYGLVFNRGEYVEGYTNLSWTLLVALGIHMGLAAPVAGHFLMIVSGAFFLISTLLLVREVLPERYRYLAALAPLTLLANNGFAAWNSAGLETSLFGGFVTLALYFHLRGRLLCVAVVCILAALTRPEGVILAAVLLGGSWFFALLRDRPRTMRDFLVHSAPCLLFAAYIVLHTAFRYFYYDDFVPNTFYAKVGGIPVSRGFEYVWKFLIDGPGFFMVPFIFICIVMPRLWLPGIYVAIIFAYSISVGGDAFWLGRFLVPLMPLLIAGVLACAVFCLKRSQILGWSVVATTVLASWVSLYGPWRDGTDFQLVKAGEFPHSIKRQSARNHQFGWSSSRLAVWAENIRGLSPEVKKIATVGIGQPGYLLMEVNFLDLVGLTNKVVAKSSKVIDGGFVIPGHHRANADYIFSQKPDLLLIPQKGRADVIQLPAVKEILDSPKLEQLYYWDGDIKAYRLKV